MHAILIDSENRTLKFVEISKKDFLHDCYKAIGCTIIEVAIDLGKNTVYIDEEGRLKEIKGEFNLEHIWFAGNGLVIGYNAEKDQHTDTDLTIEDLIKKVRFAC